MPNAPAQPDLPPIDAPAMTPGAVVDALERMSKRGKLAGFRRAETGEGGGDGAARFGAAAQGTPFDRELIGEVRAHGEGSRVEWSMRTPRKLPALFAAALVFSVWPGLPITDSMLITYSSWYAGLVADDGWFRTWMWYLPLTVPFVPLAWRSAMNKSRASSLEHAREVVDKIAKALGARDS